MWLYFSSEGLPFSLHSAVHFKTRRDLGMDGQLCLSLLLSLEEQTYSCDRYSGSFPH